MLKLFFRYSQLTKQQIINSSYEQLVQKIARNYNLKQYKNQSGLSLLQIHHQFKIFAPGDWVLDIGAGTHYAWTDLALKLTQNSQMTHQVISNDILDLKKQRQNNIFIRGDFSEEPVQTSIALQLQNHHLDSVLVDVSPQYTGNVHADGRSIMYTIGSAIQFSTNFLKKGGSFVCKVLQSEAEHLLDESFSIYFNEKYKFRPSIMRKSSPVCFYVMKGFLMSESYYALCEFLQSYKGSPDKKSKLVEKYRGKYCWDPVKHIKKYMLDQVMEMRMQGSPQKQIIQNFSNDPYFKVQKVLKLLKQADEAQRQRKMIEYHKIINQLTEGSLHKSSEGFADNFEEFYEGMLENMEKLVKEDKQKKEAKRQKISRAPLKENQTYMKAEDSVKEREEVQKVYLESDLMGMYSEKMKSEEDVNLELDKILKIHPQVARIAKDLEEASKDSSDKTIEEIIEASKKQAEGLSEEKLREIHESVEESIRRMGGEDEEEQEQEKANREAIKGYSNQMREQRSSRVISNRRGPKKRSLY